MFRIAHKIGDLHFGKVWIFINVINENDFFYEVKGSTKKSIIDWLYQDGKILDDLFLEDFLEED